MPRTLFYLGVVFSVFLALVSAATVARELDGGAPVFVAINGAGVAATPTAPWAIVVALIAGLTVAAVLIRMATLLAARNLFGGFLALFAIGAAVLSLAWVLLIQARMLMLMRRHLPLPAIDEMHFAAVMMFGYFVAFAFLALRPYFRVQASRFLSALVFFPLPLFALIFVQELFVSQTSGPLPATTPASAVFLGIVALLFFSIAVHCIRHRHMFLELTSLRELLDPRIDPTRPTGRTIGGVAFDS
jgi:hypothetical protein